MAFTIPGSDMTLEIIMIDTIILCGNTDDEIDLAPSGPVSLTAAKQHWAWLAKQIEQSTYVSTCSFMVITDSVIVVYMYV